MVIPQLKLPPVVISFKLSALVGCGRIQSAMLKFFMSERSADTPVRIEQKALFLLGERGGRPRSLLKSFYRAINVDHTLTWYERLSITFHEIVALLIDGEDGALEFPDSTALRGVKTITSSGLISGDGKGPLGPT